MMQGSFVAALWDPDAAVPAGLVDPAGRVSVKRFAVYRNNVAASLIRVLEAGFPVVRKLVGDAFFAAMAGEFMRRHPPKTRSMMLYGAEFSGFLQDFAPVADLGYLPDVARLEQAIRESYHAADAVPIDPRVLAGLAEDGFLGVRLDLAPSLRLVRSTWPVHAIWRANAGDGPQPRAGAEDTVVLRPAFDPAPELLPQGAGAFLDAILAGMTVGAALDAAGPEVELAAVLTLLLGNGAILGIRT